MEMVGLVLLGTAALALIEKTSAMEQLVKSRSERDSSSTRRPRR